MSNFRHRTRTDPNSTSPPQAEELGEPLPTVDHIEPEPAVGRRLLLRRGALLAGAAGVSVAGAALSAPSAEAADGDQMLLGQDNAATSPTDLTIGAAEGSSEATLRLTNETGPSLYLNPLPEDWSGDLRPGQIANTVSGPLIGVVQGKDNVTTQLLTEQDVWLPFILPTPMRLVDTRYAAGRERVTLPSPLAADGRLPAGRSMTIWIAPAGQGFGIPAIHLNVTVVGSQTTGYVTVYPGPERPATSTVNFKRGQTVANGAYIGTSTGTYTVQGDPPERVEALVINIRTTASAWIVIDATGAFATGFNPTAPSSDASRQRAGARRPSPATLAQRGFGKL
jgi:hypothetical protein